MTLQNKRRRKLYESFFGMFVSTCCGDVVDWDEEGYKSDDLKLKCIRGWCYSVEQDKVSPSEDDVKLGE